MNERQEEEIPLAMHIIYDAEDVYDEQIAPLMAQIIKICQDNQIPMIASFAYASDEDGGHDLCTTTLPFDGRTPRSFVIAQQVLL
jgi:hypothetical protein